MRSALESMIERRVLVAALNLMKNRPLLELLELVDKHGAANGLGQLTAEELTRDPSCRVVETRRRAEATHGAAFDELALRVLIDAQGEFVTPFFLKQRLGGPRWKLRASLERLERAGKVIRFGATSDRHYAAEVEHELV